MTGDDARDVSAALGLLDRIAVRAGEAFDGEEYDGVGGARTLLRDWLVEVERRAGEAT